MKKWIAFAEVGRHKDPWTRNGRGFHVRLVYETRLLVTDAQLEKNVKKK